jgi:hypothetical protein
MDNPVLVSEEQSSELDAPTCDWFSTQEFPVRPFLSKPRQSKAVHREPPQELDPWTVDWRNSQEFPTRPLLASRKATVAERVKLQRDRETTNPAKLLDRWQWVPCGGESVVGPRASNSVWG